MINDKQGVDGRSIYICHFPYVTVVDFFHTKPDEIIPCQFTVVSTFCMFYRKPDFDVGKHTGTLCSVHSFEFHQGGGI